MADVMDRLIAPLHQERFSAAGQQGPFRKNGIKNYARTSLGFTPHTKVAMKPILQLITCVLVRGDCKANRSRRTWIRGSAHALPEALAQGARQDRQLARSAHEIDTSE